MTEREETQLIVGLNPVECASELTHFCHTNIIQYDLTEAEMRITPSNLNTDIIHYLKCLPQVSV